MSDWSKVNIKNVHVRGLLCDLDNTLYSYNACNKAGLDAVKQMAEKNYNLSGDLFEKHWNLSRQLVHNDLAPFGAGHSRLLYAQKVAEQHFGYTHPEFTLLAEETYWSAFLDKMEWDMQAKAFLERAKMAGLDVCIITDLTAQIQHRKWLKLDLGRYARYMVTSEEAGYEKPQPAIFNLALKKLGMKPEEVIMIGDSLSKDVEGANALGIRAYHIKRDESC